MFIQTDHEQEQEQETAASPERLRARGRLARQWLIRCLHWLVAPVFLGPLGLQEASTVVEKGIGDGNGNGNGDGGGGFKGKEAIGACAGERGGENGIEIDERTGR